MMDALFRGGLYALFANLPQHDAHLRTWRDARVILAAEAKRQRKRLRQAPKGQREPAKPGEAP